MMIALDMAVRELLEEYAILRAEHQRLMASPHDRASQKAHELRLDKHFRHAQFVLERLRLRLTGDVAALNAASSGRSERPHFGSATMAHDNEYEARRADWAKASGHRQAISRIGIE